MSGQRYGSGKKSRAVCDRCKITYPYASLLRDGFSPGLYVCRRCYNPKNVYALPPPQPDAIVLKHPRPVTWPSAEFYTLSDTVILSTAQGGGIPIVNEPEGDAFAMDGFPPQPLPPGSTMPAAEKYVDIFED